MCKVKNIEECAKKLYVYTTNGETFCSVWFTDDERKNTYGEDIFTALEREHYEHILKENAIKEEDVLRWSVNRDKAEEDCVFISRHAFDRMKERNGWNKKTAIRMIKKVYDFGVDPENVKGEYRAWIKHRESKYPDSVLKMYGQNLYVFKNNILITVLQASKNYKQCYA